MRTGRLERLAEIRKWGTTEDAEQMAVNILYELPEDWDGGIFASFDDVDDDETGNGGIHLQVVDSPNTCAVVEIPPSGEFPLEGYRHIDGIGLQEAQLECPVEAADFLEMK